jgi:hypothetical protein
MDKSLSERTLDAFEYFFRESSALKLILSDHHVSGWRQELRDLMASRPMEQQIGAMFQELRAALRKERDPSKGLAALLKILPPT